MDSAGHRLRSDVRRTMEAHWRPEGFTSPNAEVYPWRWLWDSCFHGLIWLALDEPERAVAELAAVLRWQHASGFVPHVGYPTGDEPHAGFWGRPGASTITQPPMVGHLVAELHRHGVDVPQELRDGAVAFVGWLLRERRRPGGAVVIVHPWESGCDDSVHWDAWCPDGAWTKEAWFDVKGDLVRSLVLDADGAAVANPRFEVASPGFQSLVVFNAAELGLTVEPPVPLPAAGWSPLTLDDLLVALVAPDPAPLLHLLREDGPFAGPFGPAGLRRDDPRYSGSTYWRGATWPQLAYLLWVAARRAGDDTTADSLAERTVDGAVASGLAEHWDPDTGAAGGARPQSWTGLALLMAGSGQHSDKMPSGS
jgi:hypothetical protein